ncbi:MAG TPA: DUF3224 domain-containing protein [Edaphobacter sp.]|jgi:hypothetical protein|nr:DUF3224 domain-containing protein [Edaphobacter sp.]
MMIAPSSIRISSRRSRLAAACLAPLILATISTQAAPAKKEAVLSLHATGPFEVKIDPQAADEKAGGAAIGRILLDKQFHGDLEATSKGTMLAAGTGAKGSSGGYVALEIVTGTLKGRKGAFILQHTGIMNRGNPSLTVTVVPDSGTGQLVGLAGKMTINITDGKHFYDLEYTLPETP